MNVDEAMEVITGAEPSCLEHLAGAVLVAEVERLRAELAASKAEIQNIVSGQIKANGWEDCE